MNVEKIFFHAKAAKEEADRSAAEARANLALAEQRESESKANFDLAEEKRADAERSSYVANVTAADYSLRLDDVAEARSKLMNSNSLLREWEWWHIYRRAFPALEEWGRNQARPIDQLQVRHQHHNTHGGRNGR